MTTSSVSHDRQHELIEQTLHEIRGDVKWLRENQEQMAARLDRVEAAVTELQASNERQEAFNGEIKEILLELLGLIRNIN